MGAKNTKDKEENATSSAASNENLKDIEFASIQREKLATNEEKEDEKDEKKEKPMSPAIAMCFYAAKGDLEKMKEIYLQDQSSVNGSDVPEEKKDSKQKKEDEEETKPISGISGDYPLHRAAAEGHLAAVELLLNWEVDPERKNRIGSTALHRAASQGQTEVVKKLLTNGCSVHTLNKIGSSPLHCAALSGYVEIAKLICANGGFKHIRRPNLAGMTPLDYAKSRKDMWDFFLSYDVKSSVDHETKHKGGEQTTTVTFHDSPRGGSFYKKHLSVEGDNRGSFHKKTVTIQDDLPTRKSLPQESRKSLVQEDVVTRKSLSSSSEDGSDKPITTVVHITRTLSQGEK